METTRKHNDDMIRSQTQLIPAVIQNRWHYLRKAAAKMKEELREREREEKHDVLGYMKTWISSMDYCHQIPCLDQGWEV